MCISHSTVTESKPPEVDEEGFSIRPQNADILSLCAVSMQTHQLSVLNNFVLVRYSYTFLDCHCQHIVSLASVILTTLMIVTVILMMTMVRNCILCGVSVCVCVCVCVCVWQ